MRELYLTIIRINLKPTYTEGHLINENSGVNIFDTLEDTVRDINGDGDLNDEGEGKVYGETAIPYTREGEYYECEVTYSPLFKKDMVLIKDVPSFTGIRMHWGATSINSKGCILGGEKIAENRLKNTGFTKYMVYLLNQYGGKAKLKII